MDLAKKTPDLVVTGVVEGYRWVRDLYTAVKHGQYRPYSPLERKVREATRNEPWGPTGTMLNELADKSFDQQDCYVIFAIVELRLEYPPEKWRNVYKALTVLEFIMKRGSDTWVTLSQDVMPSKLEALEDFKYIDEKGHDQGMNVRHRAAAIRALLASPRVLVAEREAAARKRRQYQGYSRDDMTSSSGGNLRSSSLGSYSNYNQSRQNSNGYGRVAGDEDSDDNSQLQYHWDGPSPAGTTTSSSSAARRPGQHAGEMKGVTLEENKRNLTRLKGILSRPENRLCADCSGASSSRPTWASINTGVFICMQCAGIHRGLGVHISKVRSCTLDTWLPEQVDFLDVTGNAIANSYWEANLPPSEKPGGGDSQQLALFIRTKYSGQWAQGEWPPSEVLPARKSGPTVAAPEAVVPAPLDTASVPRLNQPARQQGTTRTNSQTQRAIPSNGVQGTSGGSFWSTFQSSNGPAVNPPPSQAMQQQEEGASVGSFWSTFQSSNGTVIDSTPPLPAQPPQRQERTVSVPTSSDLVAPTAPPPVPTFDLLSFDDVTPAQKPPASPAFSDANWGSAFAPGVSAVHVAPTYVPPPEYDLLSLMENPVQRTPPPQPVFPDTLTAQARYLPVQNGSGNEQKTEMTMAGIEELAQSPNIMDAQDLYMPSPEQKPVNCRDDSLPEVQLTGSSVVPGLDDLLNYQYTGVDARSSSNYREPMHRHQYDNRSEYHGNSNMYPQIQSGLQYGRAPWQHHGTHQSRGSSAGVTHFDSLQDEFLSSLKLASPASAKNVYKGNNQPMRTAGR